MEKIKTVVKSRTFWGWLIAVASQTAEKLGMIPAGMADTITAIGAGLGLYGARNTNPNPK